MVRSFIRLVLFSVLIQFAFGVSWAARPKPIEAPPGPTLAEILHIKLGANPERAELIAELRRLRPHGLHNANSQIILPPEYTRILFTPKFSRFIDRAQSTNPFLHPESRDYGFMVSNEVEEMAAWDYSPTTGAAFYVPNFKLPADAVQIGHISERAKIHPRVLKHILRRENGQYVMNFWFHPDDPLAYSDFVEGGAKNAPPDGYGVEWNYIGIAPNGPRSLLMINLDDPSAPPVWVKVNLHRKLEGSSRIIEPHKAARSILATRLFQENVSEYKQRKYGLRFLPEVAAVSLPYSRRSNVVRDAKPVGRRGVNYVYAYSMFSPAGAASKEEILATQLMGPNPNKTKLEKLARQIFRLMARPFAYNALVTGLNFEWHSANWMIPIKNGQIGDHILLQDMEALRYDPQIGIWSGGTARSMQAMTEPWKMAKYSNALGGNWEYLQVGSESVELQAPEFLSDEYLWRVRGLKDSKDPKDPTTIDNIWGYSTVVDVVRNYGIGVLGLELTNAEVERWMDEEMASAFNWVLREVVKVDASVIPDVTADQILREVMLTKDYESASYGISIEPDVENVRAKIHAEGGLSRALVQLRRYLRDKKTYADADIDLQKLLSQEAERLTQLRRNTTKSNWYNLNPKPDQQYFLFHEDARIIEFRDKDGWAGFFSLEPDGSKGSRAFFAEYQTIKGQLPADLTATELKRCERLLESPNVSRRNATFGSKVQK